MHAVVVSVTINDREAATDHLRTNVVPGVKQAPGRLCHPWEGVASVGPPPST